jgi:hypothetical protein
MMSSKITPEGEERRTKDVEHSSYWVTMVFDPEHPRMKTYYTVISFLIFYTLFMGPYESAFPRQSDKTSELFRIFYTSMKYMSDAGFVLDVFITMRTKVKVVTHGLETYVEDTSMIISQYLKGNFAIDIISIGLPFGLDEVLSKAFFSNQSSRNMLYRILSMLNFVKVLRIFRLNVLVFRLFKFKPTDLKWVQLARLIMCLLVMAHVIGCAFVMVATDPTGFPLRDSWIVKTNDDKFDAGNHHIHYIQSMYFSLATLTTVGYGDIHAVTTTERVFSTCMVITGAVMSAAIMGSVVSIFDLIFIDRGEKRMHKLESMMRWTKMVNLEKDDVERAANAVKLCHDTEEIGNAWLHKLSKTTRSVARDAAYRRVLDTNFAFATLDLSLRRALAQGMELQVCVKGVNMIQPHDLGRFLFIIHRGECAVIRSDKTILKRLYKGDAFGVATAFIPGLRETFATRVMSDECYLYTISSEYARKVTKHFRSKAMIRSLLNYSLEETSSIVKFSKGSMGDEKKVMNEDEEGEDTYISFVVTVTSASNLRSVGDISDPFVRVQIGDVTKTTHVLFDTENPVWNETFYIKNIKESVFRREHIFFTVLDDDAIGSRTNLGSCVINCEELFQDRRDVIRMRLPLLNKFPSELIGGRFISQDKYKRPSVSQSMKLIKKKLSWANTKKISRVSGFLSIRLSLRRSYKDMIGSEHAMLNRDILSSFCA